jgi:hypothetical protein
MTSILSHDVEPELQIPPPRRLAPNDHAWDDWGNVRFALWSWMVVLIIAAAGLPAASLSMSLAFGLWVFSGLLLLFTLLMTAGVIYCLFRDARFVRHALAGRATVLRSEVVVISYSKSYRRDIDYHFTTARGEEIVDQWKGVDVPLQKCQAGDVITVLYFPQAPRKNLPYPCALFQVHQAAKAS